MELEEEIQKKFKWLRDIPDEFKSRKLVLAVITMCLLLLVAFVGSVTSHFFGFNEGLWKDAMLYISSIGGAGTLAQTVPDALQARNGTYRQGYYNNTEKVEANPKALSNPKPIIPVTEEEVCDDPEVIDYTMPVEVTKTDSIDKM